MSLQAALDALADGLSVVGAPAVELGQPLGVALQPAPSRLNLTELTPATLKATWISKDVLFGNSDTETALRQSPPNFAALDNAITGLKPYLSNVGTFITPSGTPGLVGQLVAELPAVTKTEIPIAVSVSWSVHDKDGNALDASRARVVSPTASGATFFLAPAVIEAVGGASPTTTRQIRAAVTLTAQLGDGTALTNTNAPKRLSLDVQVPSLAVPTVLALFNHAPFDLTEHGGIPGCVLVCVPPNSPYRDISAIMSALGALSQGLSAVAGTFAQLGFLTNTLTAAQAVGRLLDLLGAVTDPSKNVKLVVRATGGERFLDKIIFYQQFLYFHTAEDTFGSLLLVGMPGKGARFYNARDMATDAGAFTLRLPADAAAAVIESLHGDPPPCDPPVALDSGPTSDYVSPPGNDTFGDRISSLEFV